MNAQFAYSSDVADRWRPLSDSDAALADVLARDASTLIRARFPGIDSNVASGAVDPEILTMVVAGMVKRAMIAPADGISQESSTVGPFARSQSYANPLGKVFLTDADLLLIQGYVPAGGSHKFGNTTTAPGESGPGYVYGYLGT